MGKPIYDENADRIKALEEKIEKLERDNKKNLSNLKELEIDTTINVEPKQETKPNEVEVDTSFTDSVVIGGLTNSGIVGGILGGDIVGGLLGDFLNGGFDD